ncbi:uncharacterized protein [Euphorbia lathyris]|uniref:uncharacterized protein n=1 Tax=Euphorbia lathyris TaxID=212925 RepID=UPI0033133BD4
MKKSPVHPNKYETGDYGVGYEFDPQLDFSQFLEEAKQHERTMNLQNSAAESEAEKVRSTEDIKKSKKSWKKSLFKWWKSDTKKNEATSSKESDNSSHISRPRKGHVSGPLYGTGRPLETKLHRQTSGPLTNLFNPTKRLGKETPYMNLDQPNNPNGVKSYGPVYLVT